jgi:peptide chain release factor 2
MDTLENLTERLSKIEPVLAIAAKREELTRLQAEASAENLWDNQEHAVEVLAQITALQKLLQQWDDLHEMLAMGSDLGEQDISSLSGEVRTLEQHALLSGPHDSQGALLTIHAGAGGVDAQDWAEMLERMYLRYIEQGRTEQVIDRTLSLDRSNWKAEILERASGEEAGIKKVTIEVKGTTAYGLLKAEAGVHRLVRLSPFNAKNLRQTSFALIEVIPLIEQASGEVQIKEDELKIDVFRSGGAGGQHVNTTDSAVRLTHLPSGIVVVVQNERSQHQNKAKAMAILQSKLLRLQELKNAEEVAILKGEFKEGSWGNQIRSYVLQPYQMVKDHRTDHETSQVNQVLDGQIGSFIEAYLIS